MVTKKKLLALFSTFLVLLVVSPLDDVVLGAVVGRSFGLSWVDSALFGVVAGVLLFVVWRKLE